MHPKKANPREDYRRQEYRRSEDSASLAETFQNLKSLTVDLTHFGPEGLTKTSEVKCTFNLAHARSLFRFDCSNEECVHGDYDLSAELANAVAARDATASGEVTCQGWRNQAGIDRVHCLNILRYRLSLGYGGGSS